MGAGERALPTGRPHDETDLVPARAFLGPHWLRLEHRIDPILAQDLADSIRHVRILAGHEARSALDDGDLAAEATEHLAELEADVAAAQHQEVIGDLVQLHDGRGVQRRHRRQTVDWRHAGAPAGVDHDGIGAQAPRAAVVQTDLQGLRPGEGRLPR